MVLFIWTPCQSVIFLLIISKHLTKVHIKISNYSKTAKHRYLQHKVATFSIKSMPFKTSPCLFYYLKPGWCHVAPSDFSTYRAQLHAGHIDFKSNLILVNKKVLIFVEVMTFLCFKIREFKKSR